MNSYMFKDQLEMQVQCLRFINEKDEVLRPEVKARNEVLIKYYEQQLNELCTI